MAGDQSKRHLEEHRQRVRDRFAATGGEDFRDYELLELLLFGVLPRIDTKPIAKELLARFRTLDGVIGAPRDKLMAVPGIGPAVATHLKALHRILVSVEREPLQNQPVLASWSAVIAYLTRLLAEETEEQVRVLFLDRKLKLIADEVQSRGTIDQAAIYPREVARRALELRAASVILTHNHPTGDPSPSRQDIAMTKDVIAALAPLGVAVHDHVIIGRDGSRSLKALGLI
jgi:DNA repair protein RadC